MEATLDLKDGPASRRMIRSSPVSSIAAAAVFVVLSAWMMASVAGAPGGALPGTHLGDNATGLWNVWWFTRAVEEGQSLFRTDRLFAPFGTQLSLHTHATTHSALAWSLIPFSSIVAAHNLAIFLGLALNGFCAWLLACRLTGRMLPSLVAGVLFACSAHVQLRVLGHINLLHAWVLPLFALALLRFEKGSSWNTAVLAGVAGALVIYTDYYYAVYAGLLCIVWSAVRLVSWHTVIRPRRLPILRAMLLGLILVDAALIAWIAWSGGTALEFGPIRISARGIRNPLTALWILTLGWASLRFPVSGSFQIRAHPSRGTIKRGLTALAVVALLAAPLLFALARVVVAGEYSSPRVLWQSSPAGADALTLLLGHPLHVLTGRWTLSAYQALDIDVMEQSLWLGIVPIVLIAATWRQCRHTPHARLWMIVAVVFFVLSLGPFLRLGGFDTALPLPQAVLRYLPATGNARIPGRAVVMVSLAVGVLTAIALSNLSLRSRRVTLLIAAVLVVETLPAPTSVVRIPMPDSIDEYLQGLPDAGAVAELPTGLRDGFGEAGAFDHRALVHQMWHGRPLVGGFVARLSPRVRAGYEEHPFLMNLINLSSPDKGAAGHIGSAVSAAPETGITHIIVNRDTFIDTRLPPAALEADGFQLVQRSGSRELYVRR